MRCSVVGGCNVFPAASGRRASKTRREAWRGFLVPANVFHQCKATHTFVSFCPTNGERRIKAGDRLKFCPNVTTMKPLLAHIHAVYSRQSRLTSSCAESSTDAKG